MLRMGPLGWRSWVRLQKLMVYGRPMWVLHKSKVCSPCGEVEKLDFDNVIDIYNVHILYICDKNFCSSL